jgi:dihydropteroate synthase
MTSFTPVSWRLRTRTLTTDDHTLIMGIVNVTPDSFSDGGEFVADTVDHYAAIAHARALTRAGADIIDVGGESTRPGADVVDDVVEAHRVVPVIAALAADGIAVSVDTSKVAVAEAALEAGAEVVNDVTGLSDPVMATLCADAGAGVVLMHMQGTPATMQNAPSYRDVAVEVVDWLIARAESAMAAGIDRDRVCLDPGIGFGKTFDHNLELLDGLPALVATGYPILVGTSRKSFLGTILSEAGVETEARQRDPATAATTALAVAAGVAAVRVHDVASTLQSARVADAIVRRSRPSDERR